MPIVTTHKHEVEEIIECFDADWNRDGHFMREIIPI